jgi:hypothetical protein
MQHFMTQKNYVSEDHRMRGMVHFRKRGQIREKRPQMQKNNPRRTRYSLVRNRVNGEKGKEGADVCGHQRKWQQNNGLQFLCRRKNISGVKI